VDKKLALSIRVFCGIIYAYVPGKPPAVKGVHYLEVENLEA
jgi:hypothetical protein